MKKNYFYEKQTTDTLNKEVFFIACGLVLFFALATIFFTKQSTEIINTTVDWVSTFFGGYYLLAAFAFFAFVIYIACSRFGRIKLGPTHSEPAFSTFEWASMLFATGIGIDLLFFSVAEPVSQYMHPPSIQGQTIQAAREAVEWTLFHYGILGWSMYALMGMTLSFFSYRYNLPLTVRSALYPLIGDRIQGWMGHAVDIAAVLGAVFGIATTLGIGVEQLNYGIYILFNIPEHLVSKIGLIVLSVAISGISAVSGVNKGIKFLAMVNVYLAIGLVIFLFVFGDTEFLFNALIQNIGDYFSFVPSKMLDTFAFNPQKEWMNTWTLFFWAWWVAWAPFVGLFLARISRGRTIREFIFGTLLIPFLFILVWVSIFGNSALNIIMHGNMDLANLIISSPEKGFYSLLAEYPWFKIVASVATFTGFLFYVTSADSAALVLGNFSVKLSDIHKDAPRKLRFFWSVIIGLITIAMLMANGIPALQNATIIMGLPFSFVMFFIMYGLYRSLKIEDFRISSQTILIKPSFDQSRQIAWQERLSNLETVPDLNTTLKILNTICTPALETIKKEFEQRNKKISLKKTSDNQTPDLYNLELIIYFLHEQDFIYRIEAKQYELPPYQEYLSVAPHYYRLESFLLDGGQGDDLISYSQDQIINDILDRYERHLHFLYLNRKAPGDSLIFPNPE